jgi:hypothetical protein
METGGIEMRVPRAENVEVEGKALDANKVVVRYPYVLLPL